MILQHTRRIDQRFSAFGVISICAAIFSFILDMLKVGAVAKREFVKLTRS